jgi:hypothetical protein
MNHLQILFTFLAQTQRFGQIQISKDIDVVVVVVQRLVAEVDLAAVAVVFVVVVARRVFLDQQSML